MKTILTRALIAAAIAATLGACASEHVAGGPGCVKTAGGKAAVTDTGVEIQEGHCVEWLFAPSRTQSATFKLQHGQPEAPKP